MRHEGPSNRLEHKLRDLWLVMGHPIEQVIDWVTKEEGIAEDDAALETALAWARAIMARSSDEYAAAD